VLQLIAYTRAVMTIREKFAGQRF